MNSLASPTRWGLFEQHGGQGLGPLRFIANERPDEPLGLMVVQHAEVGTQPHGARPVAHNAVGQGVQGADGIAQPGGPAAQGRPVLPDALPNVGRGGPGEGHDQHLGGTGFGVARQVANELAGQQAQREGLAAAGHGTNAGRPAGIVQDRFLPGAQPDAIGRCEVQDCLVQVRWRTARARGVTAG